MSSLATKMASAKLGAAAEDLAAPLLDSDSDDDSDDSGSEASTEVQKQTPLQKLKTLAVYGVLATGVAFSALAFVFVPIPLVIVAGAITIANAPYSAYKEKQLSRIPTLRGLVNDLRADANRLGEEVDTLSAEIDILEPEAERADEIADQLQEIADKQQFNVDRLVELVKENGEIIDAMKDNLKKRVVQDITKIVVSSDKDNDMTINRREAKMLALKIRIQLQNYGVEFDEERFFQAVSLNPTVPGIIGLVKKLSAKPEEIQDIEDTLSTTSKEAEEMDVLKDMFIWHGDDTGGQEKRESLMASSKRDRGSRAQTLMKNAQRRR